MQYKIKFISILSLLIMFQNHSIAQVFEHFNQSLSQLKYHWNFTDSCFWVNPKNQLQSNVKAKNVSEITANLLVSKKSQTIEWSSYIAFGFNPSPQNQVRFYLYADSVNLSQSTQAMYLQFGGINGSDDVFELIQLQGNSKQILASSLPGLLKQTASRFRFRCLIDANQLLTFQIDTGTTNGVPVFSTTAPQLPAQFYTGYWFKFTSSYVSSFIADDFYFGDIRPIAPSIDLVNVKQINDSCLQFNWNGSIDTCDFANKLSYNFESPSYFCFTAHLDTLCVYFRQQLSKLGSYEVCMKQLYSVGGAAIPDTCLYWQQYEPELADIVFSELMIDPDPIIGLPNAEFIELYNQSSYALNLKGFYITDKQTVSELGDYFLKPQEFVMLCSCKDSALFSSIPKLCVASLPSLNNVSDTLQLFSKQGLLLNQIMYNSNWYHSNPLPNGGRSLCLRSTNNNCNQIDNWQASSDSCGGSPGKPGLDWNSYSDSVKLSLIQFSAIDSFHVLLVFNKTLVSIELKCLGLNAILKWQSLNADSFVFETSPFKNNQDIVIQLNQTCACNNNCLDTNFIYFFVTLKNAFYNDLVFSELLFEPLVNSEVPAFIEIYNKSNYRVNLSDYNICNGNQCIELPAYEMYPDSFVVIAKSKLLSVKNQITLPKLFSLNLTDTLLIRNKDHLLVSFLPYSQNFYHDLFKQNQKGWSVECMNLKMPCMGSENWHASMHENKHTAGVVNSIGHANTDTIAPKLLQLYPVNASQLLLKFNEPIDSSYMDHHLQILPASNPFNWHFTNNNQTVLLTLKVHLLQQVNYELFLNQIPDCAGNVLTASSFPFALPEKIDSGNLLLNEVLFDPVPGASDFIEIYNNSSKYLDLKSVYIGLKSSQEDQYQSICSIAPNGYLMSPLDYVVISQLDQSTYFNEVNFSKQILVNLPNLSNDGAWLELLASDQSILDAMPFNSQMHFQLLPTFEGVSLERLSSALPATYPENWHSASAQQQYGTPTRSNSMQMKKLNNNNQLSVFPEVFSPDNDGYQDVVQIAYLFNQLENFSTLTIYNRYGLPVKDFANAYWGGNQGKWIWNGLDNENNPLPEGFYVVKLNIFMPDGTVDTQRKTIVLASRERN